MSDRWLPVEHSNLAVSALLLLTGLQRGILLLWQRRWCRQPAECKKGCSLGPHTWLGRRRTIPFMPCFAPCMHCMCDSLGLQICICCMHCSYDLIAMRAAVK